MTVLRLITLFIMGVVTGRLFIHGDVFGGVLTICAIGTLITYSFLVEAKAYDADRK